MWTRPFGPCPHISLAHVLGRSLGINSGNNSCSLRSINCAVIKKPGDGCFGVVSLMI